MARSKGYTVVLKDKTGKLQTVDCTDLEAVDKALGTYAAEPEDVYVFGSQPVEIRRSLTISKAPRKTRTPKAKPDKPNAPKAA
jgi:hypothetical protein